MRKDPPVDEAYLYATHLLELGERRGVRVINRPASLRAWNEKLSSLRFSHLMAPSMVSSRVEALAAFAQQLRLAHAELEVINLEDDELRPRFFCKVNRTVAHRPFLGMNRARAAVLEAAILSTRLDRLPREKIDSEIGYLQIAIDKTAGDAEREAWEMVMAKIAEHFETQDK